MNIFKKLYRRFFGNPFLQAACLVMERRRFYTCIAILTFGSEKECRFYQQMFDCSYDCFIQKLYELGVDVGPNETEEKDEYLKEVRVLALCLASAAYESGDTFE